MINEGDYFGSKPHTEEQERAAEALLTKVNDMLTFLEWDFPTDPDTGTSISGSRGGSGDGGFRLPDTKTGHVRSEHKRAHAVDPYDPENKLDDMITDDILKRFGLYREAPSMTVGWVHLQDVAPGSGKRTFLP